MFPRDTGGDGQVRLVHHATAEQGVDVRSVVFDDYATQRDLSGKGRAETKEVGASLETARLTKAGRVEIAAASQNTHDDGRNAETLRNLDEATRIIESWCGPGARVNRLPARLASWYDRPA